MNKNHYIILLYKWHTHKYFYIYELKNQLKVGRNCYEGICIGVDPPDLSISKELLVVKKSDDGCQVSYIESNPKKRTFEAFSKSGASIHFDHSIILNNEDYLESKSNVHWQLHYYKTAMDLADLEKSMEKIRGQFEGVKKRIPLDENFPNFGDIIVETREIKKLILHLQIQLKDLLIWPILAK